MAALRITVMLNENEADRAAEILRSGGLVVFPTETVYGLGANALDPAACARIFAAKGRPADNPLIVHLAEISQLPTVARQIEPVCRLLFERFTPGPLTVILPRSQQIPDIVTAGLDSVAVRIPSSAIARAILTQCEFPLAAPSANRSGRPSPTDFDAAVEHMNGRVEAIVHGPDCEIGLESTIVRVSRGRVEVLREGAVTREMLRAVVRGTGELVEPPGGDVIAPAVEPADGPAEAPGTRYRHYQPEARLFAVESADLTAALRRHAGPQTALLALNQLPSAVQGADYRKQFLFESVEHYARELYRILRTCDRSGCTMIVAELPPAAGVGRALRDRLLRAAG